MGEPKGVAASAKVVSPFRALIVKNHSRFILGDFLSDGLYLIEERERNVIDLARPIHSAVEFRAVALFLSLRGRAEAGSVDTGAGLLLGDEVLQEGLEAAKVDSLAVVSLLDAHEVLVHFS